MPMTVREVTRRKGGTPPLVMVTAYDYPTARCVAEAGVDLILVGDSLGNVVLGHPSTLPVTVEDMIRAAQAAGRGAPDVLRVVDLPFLTYATVDRALNTAGRVLRETGAGAVKLEGGERMAPQVEALVQSGVPVMGHIGFTPQSELRLGRRVQARGEAGAARLRRDARALAEAGAFAIVVELVPAEVAAEVTAEVPIPTIGIGAGPHCDGQVLVLHDLIGLDFGPVKRHVRQYADVAGAIRQAVRAYAAEVRDGAFPGPEHAAHRPAPRTDP
jgi:3-methyl-2-oxobutanoate hydroxymethyltransferase